MDFMKYKDSLFSGSATNIEKVEVNQRHLIDKILARYSAEFTVYRELIQNANDASATEVQIEFKTTSEDSSSKRPLIKSIVIRNNGRAFTDDDWRRLKKIAEGNPDEQKIGFFGVGFYSLFSICEEPLVISGSKCLGFYWNGDQLYTKSAPYTENTMNWTSICLELREPLELPDYDEFGQFLCKSLLFTYSLSRASFIVDGKLELKCNKVLSPSSILNHSKFKTSSGLFNLNSFEGRVVQMTLEKNYQSHEHDINTSSASSVFSSIWKMAQSTFTEKGKEEAALDAKLRLPGTYHVFLKHFRASASVKTSSKFANEMERTTKKKPFQNVNIDLIYINWEQINATNGESLEGTKISTKHPILSKLLPFPTNGKVFIGFETHQTSGLGVHFTAPFIPTVERESIDFVDGCLKIWNIELVQMTGRLCRLIYEEEITNIQFKTDNNYLKKAKHVMEAFNFKNSTPSGIIGWTLFDEFLKYPFELKLPSSNGFVSASLLRHVPEEMLKFVRNTPRIPDAVATVCQEVLQKLASNQESSPAASIKTVSVRDIIEFELKHENKMTEKQTVDCLKWWIRYLANPYDASRSQLTQGLADEFASCILIPSAQGPNTFLPLIKMTFFAGDELSGLYFSQKATIKFFPIDCISPAFSANFSGSDLSIVLSFQELNLADWLDGIVKWSQAKDAIESDAEKAEQLLMLLSKSYNNPPNSLQLSIFQGRICNALASLRCIPIGDEILKKPKDCYFEDVPQLQVSMNIIKFSSESRRNRVNENMIKAAGVLSHLPLDQIFANIGSLKWDHVSLIKYLVRVKAELSSSDMSKLKSTAIFPDIEESGIYKLSELYADILNQEIIRILGLKILKWGPGIPKDGSEIGEFLTDLGFNYIVPWQILLKGVSIASPSDRSLIFRYFFENFSYYEDYNGSKIDFPFVLVESDDGTDLSVFLPSQVFLDNPLSHLGFYLINPELKKYSQLIGVKDRPSTELIVKQICKTKLGIKRAEQVFSYCARISNEFTREDWRLFQNNQFIPCKISESDQIVYKSYDQVFLVSESSAFSDLFDQVDFGIQGNSFLRSVGVVDEPRAENLISLLLNDPIKVFSQLKATKYIELIQRISNQWSLICSKHANLAKSFALSKVFIGFIRSGERSNLEKESEDEKLQYSLYGINELFLIDDIISHQLFNLPTVTSNLEQFYLKLGCRWVSSVIRSEWKWTGQVQSEGNLIKSTRKIFSERQNLIISSLDGNDGDGSKVIKNGRKRFEAIKLFQVDSIEICRTCTVNKQTDSQPSCAFTDGAVAHPSIYLAKNSDGQFDHFDLAAVIVSLLCEKKGRLQDSLLVASLLATPLSSLRAKGFQLDNDVKKAEEIVLPEPQKQIESIKSPEPLERSQEFKKIVPELEYQTPSLENQQTAPIPTPSTESAHAPSQSQAKISNSKRWSESILGFLKKTTDSFKNNISNENLFKAGKAGEARNEETIRNALDRGIKSLRPHKSGDFEAVDRPINDEPAPENQKVRRELNSYCQVLSSLRFIGKMGKVDIYAGESLKSNDFLTDTKESLICFYGLIVDQLAYSIFRVSPESSSIHLYYDPESSTVAFNRAHSLFFNFAYFIANQHFSILNGSDFKEIQRCKSFWFMTFCHELAHNFVYEHDAQHEFYLSSFAEQFLPDFIKLL